jgi:hypothetical protein
MHEIMTPTVFWFDADANGALRSPSSLAGRCER